MNSLLKVEKIHLAFLNIQNLLEHKKKKKDELFYSKTTQNLSNDRKFHSTHQHCGKKQDFIRKRNN